MNYIQEINEFYNWLELHSLSKSTIALWHALMHMNNKSRWAKEFTVSMRTLEGKTGFKRTELFKARTELTELGRIKWQERNGNQCAVYSMCSFCGHNTDTNGENSVNESDNNIGKKSGKKKGSKPMIIIKQNKILQNKTGNEPEGYLSSSDDPMIIEEVICYKYNEICKNMRPVKLLSEERRKTINSRLVEHGYDNVIKMLHMASKSNFLNGENRKDWSADFNWIFRPQNFVKVFEGKYQNLLNRPQSNTYGLKPSPIELLENAYNNITGDENC